MRAYKISKNIVIIMTLWSQTWKGVHGVTWDKSPIICQKGYCIRQKRLSVPLCSCCYEQRASTSNRTFNFDSQRMICIFNFINLFRSGQKKKNIKIWKSSSWQFTGSFDRPVYQISILYSSIAPPTNDAKSWNTFNYWCVK